MSRRKKEKSLQVEEKNEAVMTEQVIIDAIETAEKELDQKRMELEIVKRELEEKKAELAKVPARVIDEDEKEVLKKHEGLSKEKQSLKEKIERQKAHDNELVTGRFTNRRVPGQPAKVPYIKYSDDPVRWWNFQDGQVYTIPRGLADQLNGGSEDDPCYYMPRFIQKTGEYIPSQTAGENSQISQVDTSNKKFMFSPVGF